jgi:hypothetical protein
MFLLRSIAKWTIQLGRTAVMLATLSLSEGENRKDTVASGNGADIAAAEGISDADRERFLLQWTTARCGDDGALFSFDEGWEVIVKFGLNVLSEMLREFLLCTNGREKKER